MFLKRDYELNVLNQNYDKPSSSVQLIFAAKGVGKTSLLNEFSKNKEVVFLTNYEMIPNKFFSQMANVICNHFKKCTLDMPLNSFYEVLLYLSKQEIKTKTTIIFDDFQNVLKADKDSLKSLIDIWKDKLKDKNIQIIISSSLIFKEKNLYEIKKISSDILTLKHLTFDCISNFLPKLNRIDQLYVYSLLGTSPKYLKYYNDELNFTENIYNLFLHSNSYLYDLGINILKSELNDIGTYCSILQSIAQGNSKIGDIAQSLDIQATYLTRYLQKLTEMMIITKEIPINQNLKNSKFGRYIIEDSALKFWFAYIYSNISFLQSGNIKKVSSIIQEDFISKTVFKSYKKCISEFIDKNKKNIFGYEPLFINSWWDNNNSIDLIAYDRKTITFVEILWEDKDMAKISYGKLKVLSEKFKTTLSKKYIIISKDTFLNMKL